MENIKHGFSLSGESVHQQSFNKINRNDIFEVLESRDDVACNSRKSPIDNLPWVIENIVFPCGTEFRGKYKGYFYYGKINGGALMINGKRFLSLSAAAITITRSDIDGWLFWDCKFPGATSWIDIYSLKQEK